LDLSCVRIALSGAEMVRPETLERFTEAFAPYGFNPEAWAPSYGMAEATLGVTNAWRSTKLAVTGFAAGELERNRAVPVVASNATCRRLVGCGGPIDDTEVLIVDPQRRVELPAGGIGEVWVRSPSVARGYWNRPAETEQTFGGRLAESPERGPFLRTGDLGFLHDGQLYPVARLKELMIFWGRNVYPQDVEATVTRCHPALKEHGGAAFAVEIDGSEQLVVVQEVTATGKPDLDALAADVRRAILLDHRVPLHALVLLKPGSVPKTSSGKIQRLDARERYLRGSLAVVRQWEFGTDAALGSGRAAGAEPRTEDEIRDWLRTRVAKHCGVTADAIDVTRPLTEYVLDSVTLVALAVEMEAWLGVAVEPTVVFDAPSAAELAKRLAALTTAAGPVESTPAVDDLSEQDLDRALAHLLGGADAGSAAINVGAQR
jgi:acyl carrier protein